MTNVTMKQLLEAGVHFGHQSRRWNPKMKPYIYTERNGIYIIDLKKTLRLLRDATRFVRDSAAGGKKVLFVGTKKQAKEIIQQCADTCGMYYVNNRWLGGLLTNFQTVRKSVLRLIELEELFNSGQANMYVKKEQAALSREMTALQKNLSGIKKMSGLPDVLFVIDPSKEQIAVKEAQALRIPVVAVVDTNCNPDQVDWVIPGNDDAIRSIKLMCEAVRDSCLEGIAVLTEGEMGGLGAASDEESATSEETATGPDGTPVALSAAELESKFAVFSGGSPDAGTPPGAPVPDMGPTQ